MIQMNSLSLIYYKSLWRLGGPLQEADASPARDLGVK